MPASNNVRYRSSTWRRSEDGSARRSTRRRRAFSTHCQFLMGPEVTAFEQQLAAFCGAKHALSCSSGTDALVMILMAKGIGRGDAVFCPTFTFCATAESAALVRRDAGFRRRRSRHLQHRCAEPEIGDRDRQGQGPQAQGRDPGRSVRAAGRSRRHRRSVAARRSCSFSTMPRRASAAPTRAARSASSVMPPRPASFRPSRSAATATAARC